MSHSAKTPLRCAVIGLGEAGAKYAAALTDSGHTVAGFDPGPTETPPGVSRTATAAEAANGADVILVLTAAKASRPVADSVIASLKPGCCYADFTSSSPSAMREVGELTERAGAKFCDVAILGPVSWHGAKTPLMLAGSGSSLIAELAQEWGAPNEIVDGAPGSAMAHKLLRSVLMKGLAGVVTEAVTAGAAAGYEQWIRDQIAAQLAGDGHAVVDRLLTGTRTHAERRSHEMHDTAQYLADLGVPSEITEATATALKRIAGEQRSSEQHAAESTAHP
ncbi:NAD(P)-binding domain-containing protein [Mycolicibacterium sp. BiH015]|uniref:NAD(P)-dependent oxidoreductase n=1 Tax=Mycolicibacterium sp. BiH015 TaxID=3018808 RepID=UPI0022E2A185|nr:NAD(P)-dependent oxidoreductase [Mycolicibacterium sp. BiH015]MDA2892553.1 NAD(P)-binding domain-containing protein [Mycolicibacterium sp. BiH015]